MSVAVTCPHCNRSFQVKDEYAGKQGKCPSCQKVLQVPRASPAGKPPKTEPGRQPQAAPTPAPTPAPQKEAPSAEPDQGLGQEVLGAFRGDITPVRAPITYRFGILLVAVLMVILPLLYIALIGSVCYLIYFHAAHDTGLLEAGRGRGRAFGMLVLYAGPLLAGGILVLFMIKPLFARPAVQRRTRSLTRKSDPLLFAFVDRVCAAIRAPKPKRIDVDCQVNASASFRRGWLSMLGSDLVLTIGLPLAAGLSLRQFAGVLAHEFGHFSQGAGMRLTYVIRSVSWWFTRVVYERDQWDQKLIHWSENMDWRIAIVLYLARFFVWLTRRILWVLMLVGHVVSGFLLRQMEFDADRHQVRLAGNDSFEPTLRRIALLSVANQGAQADLGTFYQEGRLGDNLPRLIMANVQQVPAEVHAKINQMIDESTTGLLDTHPCGRDRIANARRENDPGIFHVERPAPILFGAFDALSRNVTWDFYRGIFGPGFKPSEMHPIDDLLARQTREQEAQKALGRYFQGAFSPLRPLPLPAMPPGAPDDPRECAARVKAARKRMLELEPAYAKAFAVYDQADTHLLEANQASAVLSAALKVGPTEFSLDLTSGATAARARNEAAARQEKAAPELAPFEKAAAGRLFGAMELLCVPQVAAKMENAEDQKLQCTRALSALASLNHHAHTILQLRNDHAALGILLSKLQGNEANEQLIQEIRANMDFVWERVKDLRTHLKSVPYPLDHAKGEISIGHYMLGELPAEDDLVAVLNAGQAVWENLMTLYVRLVGRLVVVAERVEKLLGLEPLPEPPEDNRAPETAGGPSGE